MEAYLGEIRMFAGTFAPVGWAFCEGQVLSIAEYSELFSVLGNAYGGDGVTTFALPDMRGRIPIHQSPTHMLGEMAGVERVTLTHSDLPTHKHQAYASLNEGSGGGSGNVLGKATIYTSKGNSVTMSTLALASVGGSQPHENMQPSLCVSFIICVRGLFPPQD
nr:MAG: phage tail protein [Pseudomonadota bacterium]